MRDEVRFLKEIVSIQSCTGKTDEVARALMKWCSDLGLEAIEDDGAIVINPEGKELLLLGHKDTVSGDIPVRIEDGELWGRGAIDAKGPLCAAICALSRIEKREGISLVAVPDEEGSSATAHRIARKWEPRPTVILEPSGVNGITIQYNGRLLLDVSASADKSHSGFDQTFATEILYDYHRKLSEMSSPRILSMSGDMERARMMIDIRFEEEPQLPVLERVEVEIIERVGMHRSDRRSILVRSFLRSMRSIGIKAVFKRKTGTCDMNILGGAWAAPIIAYGPGDGRLDHTDEERISIDEYLSSIDILEGAVREFLSGTRNDTIKDAQRQNH